MRRDAADEFAHELNRRGLALPGRVLLEAHRPVAPLVADVATFLGPLLGVVGGRAAAAGDLLARPDGLDRLIERLDGDEPCPTPES